MGALSPAAFEVRYTYNRIKDKSPYQLVFGRDMILLDKTCSGFEIHISAQAMENKKTPYVKIKMELITIIGLDIESL